jgi:hypothetical protein
VYVRSDEMAREWAYVPAVARLELAVSARSSASYGAHAAWSLVGFVLGLTWFDTGLVRCRTGLMWSGTGLIWSGTGRVRP